MKVAGVFLLSALFTMAGYAQNTHGKIVGKIIENSSSKGISGETVLLFRDDVQFASARSGSGGNFSFVSVESGDYLLKIKKQGFLSYSKRLRINPNFTTKIVAVLEANSANNENSLADKKTEERKKSDIAKANTETIAALNQKTEVQLASVSATQQGTEIKNIQDAAAEPEQIAIDSNLEPVYYDAVEEMPEPVDGWSALMKNIEYPSDASKLNIQGNVYLQAFVNKEGEVTNILVLKSIPMLDLSAQEAVYRTKFKPGVLGNQPVNSKVTIKVPFKLAR